MFNGLTHDSFIVEYQKKEDCMSHDAFGAIQKMPWSAAGTTLREVLAQTQRDLGKSAVVYFDRDIASTAACSCVYKKDLLPRCTK